jgi:hypothetical protein
MMMLLFLMLNLLLRLMNQVLFVLEQEEHEVFDWYHWDLEL